MKVTTNNSRVGRLSAQAVSAVQDGNVIGWREMFYILDLDEWASAVRTWIGERQMPIVKRVLSRMTVSACRDALLEAAVLVFVVDYAPVAWCVPASPYWQARVEAGDSGPDDAWLVEMGLR